METPNTKAGRVTEQIMEAFQPRGYVKTMMPALDTAQYNALYMHVLSTLQKAFEGK